MAGKLKFACNIGTMFLPDTALAERLKSALSHGFSSIEVAFPYTWPISEWVTALHAHPIHVSLINTPLGDKREPGLAACQDKQDQFLAGVRKGVAYFLTACYQDCFSNHKREDVKNWFFRCLYSHH